MKQNRHKPDEQARDPRTAGNTAVLEKLLAGRPDSLEELLAGISPEIYQSLREAVALGKWPDGAALRREQVEDCLQMLILYEERHLPAARRTFNMVPRGCDAQPGPRSYEPGETQS